MRPRPTWLARHTLLLPMLALLALSLALAGCGGASATSPAAPPPHRARIIYDGYQTATHPSDWARVTFTADVSYAQGVALLANQGLFPYGGYCDGWAFTSASEGTPPPNAVEMGIRWLQPSANTLSGPAPTTHVIPVYAPAALGYAPPVPGMGPAVPVDWITRLAALPQVTAIEDLELPISCPMIPIGRTAPGRAYFLASAGSQTSPTYLQVTFASSVSYDDAVTVALSQGMRLANPCAEGARASWRPLSQESAYASAHALTLALTSASSTLWRQQLRAISGVASYQAPYTPAC
jgi:hypothetical protein